VAGGATCRRPVPSDRYCPFNFPHLGCQAVYRVQAPNTAGIGAVVLNVFDHTLALIIIGKQAGVFRIVDTLDAVFFIQEDATIAGLLAAAEVFPTQLVAVLRYQLGRLLW